LEEWVLFEARALTEERSLDLLEHASTCDACGALVRDLEAEPEESTNQPVLRSATPEGKQEILRKIAASRSAQPIRMKRPAFRTSWALAAAAGILLAVAGGWRVYCQNAPDEAFRLLADAYSQQRLIEFRIPGASHSTVDPQRGSSRPAPASLAEAEALIARKLETQPGNPEWLRASARAELLRSNYALAVENLRKAEQTEPQNSDILPDILEDLGVAYLERATAEERPQDNAQAVELLSKAVSAKPSNAVFRYNLALAFERLPAPRSAVEAWKEFLRLEGRGGWADEAREHQIRQEELIEKQKKATGPERGEDTILALASRGFQGSDGIDPRAIARGLAEQNGDPWMSDFLAKDRAASSESGDKLLAAASHATASGEANEAEAGWIKAEAAFRAAGNAPGMVFAQLERGYVLQRLSRSRECRLVADTALSQAQAQHYRWIEIQSQLVRTACLTLDGEFDAAYRSSLAAQQVSEEAGYETLAQQSLGRRASVLRSAGAYREALKLDRQGLARYSENGGDVGRAYQFYYGLATSASELQLTRSAQALMREAAELSNSLPNLPVRAMVRGRYGETLVSGGQMEEAQRQFSESAKIFGGLKDSAALRLYEARAALSEVKADIEQKKVQAGLEKLRHLETSLPLVRNAVIEGELWQSKAHLLGLANRQPEAEDCLRRVLALNGSGAGAAAQAGDPTALSRLVADAAADLTDRMVERGQVAEALRLWMSYNPCFRTLDESFRGARVFYADLPGGPGVWAINADRIQFKRLPLTGAEVLRLSVDFRRRLSDPKTPVESLRRNGRDLYQKLISPIQELLPEHGVLYIATDDHFADVPFGALVSADGSWAVDRYDIIYSPAFAGVRSDRRPGVGRDSRLLALAAGDAARVFDSVLPELPGLEADLQSAAEAFPSATVFSNSSGSVTALLAALPDSDVFHFSGHVITTAGDAALVLSAPQSSDPGGRALWVSRISSGAGGNVLHRCRLAFLAACSTGKAADEDADASSAMARAFLLAGVPEVVASRWDVDSAATSMLVRSFYADLAKGWDAAEALSASKRLLRRQGNYSHPYYWAAFDVFRS
jgi:CHAT domain-containing protein